MMNFLSFLCVILLLNFTQCSNILVICNAPSKSITILGFKLAKGMINRGHHVTMASPQILEPTEGLTRIYLKSIADYKDWKNAVEPSSGLQTILTMKKFFLKLIDLFWEEPEIQKIIKEKPKFDIVILINFVNDAALGIAHHLGVPTILFSTIGSNSLNNLYVANPNMVYVPNMFLSLSTESFLGRLSTVTINCLTYLMVRIFIYPHQQDILNKYLPDSPPLEDLQKNISLMLMNSHYSIEPPRPHVPNAIQIGGFHLHETNELPEEIKSYLDNADHGAILFSKGSIVKISVFEEHKLQAIFKVLGELAPMKIVFKSELQHNNVPQNIMVKKWLPQADILAHPNIRAFISHGGLGGNTEAVYHGVPILGMPWFGDQKMNVDQAVAAGYAVRVDVEHLNEDLLRNKLKEILENPRYRENAKKRSALMKGQIINPMDNAAFWIEHIIKYGSGSHLRNAGMDLSWYQLYMVDIYAFYTVFLCFISFMIYISMKISFNFLRRLCSKNKVKTKQS